jgi:hypothetical protein
MPRLRNAGVSLIGLLSLILVAPLPADSPAAEKKPGAKKTAPSKFIRVTRDDRGDPLALVTAITRYVPAAGEGGAVVDLISAVHVGERAYYQKLDKQLDQYDVVLYELVAPQGTRIPKGGRRDTDNPLALLQQLMKGALQLESQTEQIDYTRKHFVHADLSPDQMAEAMKERGDNGLTLILGITADMMRLMNRQEMQRQKAPAKPDPELDLFSLLVDPNGPVKLKRVMAEQMETMESPDTGLGQTLNTILITDRNKAALQVFQKELAKGKKKIALFYGAGHMPDFEQRLRADFGLKKESEQWLPAWDLRLKR